MCRTSRGNRVGEEVFSGGGEIVDSGGDIGGYGSSSGMPGKVPRGSMSEAAGAGSGGVYGIGGGGDGGAFDDYDEEEVSARLCKLVFVVCCLFLLPFLFAVTSWSIEITPDKDFV